MNYYNLYNLSIHDNFGNISLYWTDGTYPVSVLIILIEFFEKLKTNKDYMDFLENIRNDEDYITHCNAEKWEKRSENMEMMLKYGDLYD